MSLHPGEIKAKDNFSIYPRQRGFLNPGRLVKSADPGVFRSGKDRIHDRQRILDNSDMTDVSTALLDAKLEAAEARTEARVARLETLVENSIKSMDEFKTELKTEIKKEFTTELKETRKYLSNLKLQAALFSVAMAATVIFGVAAFNSTLLANMMNTYEMGKDARETIKLEVASQNKEMTAKYSEMSGKYTEMSGKYSEMSGKLDDLTKAVNQLISAYTNTTIAPQRAPILNK